MKNIEEIERLQVDSLEHYADALIEAENLLLSYDNIPVFKPISFALNQGGNV